MSYHCQVRRAERQVLMNNYLTDRGNKARGQSIQASSQGTERIFDRLKNLRGQFDHTGPFNIFAQFIRVYKRLSVYISVPLERFL